MYTHCSVDVSGIIIKVLERIDLFNFLQKEHMRLQLYTVQVLLFQNDNLVMFLFVVAYLGGQLASAPGNTYLPMNRPHTRSSYCQARRSPAICR